MTVLNVIKESESGRYRVIERIGKPGEYMLQQHSGIWKSYAEYKRASAAIKKMEKLDTIWRKFLESLEKHMD